MYSFSNDITYETYSHKMDEGTTVFDNALKRVNFYLKMTGIHFNLNEYDTSFRVWSRRRWYFMFVIFWLNQDVLAEVMWSIDSAKRGVPLEELTFTAPATAYCFLSDVKAFFFSWNERHINDLVNTLKMLQSQSLAGKPKHRKALQKHAFFLDAVTRGVFAINAIAIAGFAFLPFVVMTMTYLESGKVQLMLPFSALYPFDLTDPRYWGFAFLHIMYSACMVVLLVLGADCVYYMFCTFIQIQFRFLKYDTEEFVNRVKNESDRAHNNTWKELIILIKRHNELFRCVSLVEQSYSKSTLFNAVTSSFLICLTGFNLTAMNDWYLVVPFIGFLLLSLFQIFLFCYFGDSVMRSSEAVSQAVYNSEWYNEDVRTMKDLLFILTRAQKPCKFTAFGFSDIHLKTFSTILSTAWSYFALLSSVRKR